MERLTSDETTKRWEFLLNIQKLKPTLSDIDTSSYTTVHHGNNIKNTTTTKTATTSGNPIVVEEDVFDCRSVGVLPTYDLVDRELQTYLKKWQQLDDRKLRRSPSIQTKTTATTTTTRPVKRHKAEELDGNNDGSGDVSKLEENCIGDGELFDTDNTLTSNRNSGGWRYREDRLQLPEHFDYATTRKEPPADDGVSGDRVISLDNPTQTLSYERELWKLFASIPSSDDLEYKARADHQMIHTHRIFQEVNDVNRKSADCHSLARLRMSDRHGLPPIVRKDRTTRALESRIAPSTSSSDGCGMMVPTIRLECWRRQPKRSASPDSDRLVLEFLAEQTLWDVHCNLVEMVEDGLWATAAIAANSADPKPTDVDQSTSDNASTTTNREESNRKFDQTSSGCFFIEDSFYVAGPVNYIESLLDWIDGHGSTPNPARRGYLGISAQAPLNDYKRMKDTKLGQVPFRLGVRYYHVCHGDVETSVMLTDRTLARQDICGASSPNEIAYPLIHDIWTPSRATLIPMCEGCQTHQAVFVTSTECKATDGGPRALCDECSNDLRLLDDESQSVMLYTTWRNEAEISTGLARQFVTLF